MSEPLPMITWSRPKHGVAADALREEWLVTNGLGGYASGTVALCNTRKYHGLFVPALAHFGRTVMLAHVDDVVVLDGREHHLSSLEQAGQPLHLASLEWIDGFTLAGLMPTWNFAVGLVRLKKTIVFVHSENTLYVVYRHDGGPNVQLRLRPYPTFRPHEVDPHHDAPRQLVRLDTDGVSVAMHDQAPALKLKVLGERVQPFVALFAQTQPVVYRLEAARGYPATEVLTSPGYFECTLQPGRAISLCASLDAWETLTRNPSDVLDWETQREQRLLEGCRPRDAVSARLALAADQFIITPKHRSPDGAWSHATGQYVRSLIAGYPWFTDWGRDTMISLEGLTLCTGRPRAAAAILRTFQHHVKDGLVPNCFPEGEQEGVYPTADATLWFFHAVDRYLRHTPDPALLHDLWPTLVEIVECHQRGTRFGIGVDSADGLLRQGQGGYPLTWMDAKVEDWVVTPRRGKAVELQALWFNALELMAGWAEAMHANPAPFSEGAARTKASFNARFWNPETGCLFDVVDGERGDDPSIRPNQLFAISLTHPVLDAARWPQVLGVVRRELLTPVGLRTLSAHHKDFKPTYDGDVRARDAAYHQGTVWPWLIGHYVDAVLKVSNNDVGEARAVLQGLVEHLEDCGVGTVSEIFDASPPYAARGCIAQAWSVAETLRVWLKVNALRVSG